MSNSTRLRSDMYDRLRNCDRRGFLKGAAGVLGGTAVSKPVAGSIAARRPSAGMFDGFKISKIQTTGATINVIVGRSRSAGVALARQPADSRHVAQTRTAAG